MKPPRRGAAATRAKTNHRATGRKVSMSGIDVFRVANGQIQELHLAQDALMLMQQLGVIPG